MNCAHTVDYDLPTWVEPAPGSKDTCQDCDALGENVWAHLRMCLTCGHVACCDSSPHRHATAHHHAHRPPGDALVRAGGELAVVLRGPAHRLAVA